MVCAFACAQIVAPFSASFSARAQVNTASLTGLVADQTNAALVHAHVTATNRAFESSAVLHAMSPWTVSGRAALDQLIQFQAAIISYIDDFKLMMLLSLAAIPLVLLLRKAAAPSGSDHAAVME